MPKSLFKVLAKINKILPSYVYRDLNKLSKVDKAIIAWRYYITTNSLD